MDLIIDVGNSFAKVAVLEYDTIVFHEKYQEINASIIFEIKNKFDIKRAIISSVRNNEAEISAIFKKLTFHYAG